MKSRRTTEHFSPFSHHRVAHHPGWCAHGASSVRQPTADGAPSMDGAPTKHDLKPLYCTVEGMYDRSKKASFKLRSTLKLVKM